MQQGTRFLHLRAEGVGGRRGDGEVRDTHLLAAGLCLYLYFRAAPYLFILVPSPSRGSPFALLWQNQNIPLQVVPPTPFSTHK